VDEPPSGKERRSCRNCFTPEDAEEERKVHKLAANRHAAPGDWIFRARIVSLSWRGLRTTGIAEELGCHPRRPYASASIASIAKG
jgi:hypothetical protein